MTNEEAIKLIDDRMCWGRGRWSKHHMPEIDEYWQAGVMAIDALKVQMDKPMKLSTVCLLCKKPAVTFSTDDDIPYTNYSYCEDCLRKGLKLLKAQPIMALPSAQPERNTGKWIKEKSRGDLYKCSVCGNYLDFRGVNVGRGSANFCPNCGADMRGEQDDR